MQENFTFTILDGGVVDYSGSVPDNLKDHHIPGCRLRTLHTTQGDICLQVMDTGDLGICVAMVSLRRDVSIAIKIHQPLAAVIINWQGVLKCSYQNSDLLIKEGEFKIACLSVGDFSVLFGKQLTGIFIVSVYPSNYLNQRLQFFPSVTAFAERMKKEAPLIFPEQPTVMGADCTQRLFQLLHAPFSPAVAAFHENLSKKILQDLLVRASRNMPVVKKIRPEKMSLVHRARQFIDNNLYEHFTIAQIAKQVGLNTRDLKSGFKQAFKIGLYQYLLQQRLIIAKAELEQTHKPVKQIARKARYRSPANFSTAFKKQFGKTPLQCRKDAGR